MKSTTTYAVVGLGGRSRMYLEAAGKTYSGNSRLVALCDSNRGRLDLAAALPYVQPHSPRLFSGDDFDRLVSETKPDTIIIACQDSFHDGYICRAMELGCDVITEKPMTTDAEKARRILDTQKQTGRSVRVTFNYRYSPPRTQVKDLLMSGVIGEVLSVDFQWMLDTVHGADYFRRWHRNKRNSGGLLVHKSTHHFDLVNWWLSAMPEEVVATGHRRFATPQTARRMGLANPGPRCTGCFDRQACPFFLDLAANDELNALYLTQEAHDGYHRDQCIFSPDTDIEDSMQVLVNYDNGVTLNYSLNAFCAWEGYVIQFNGTKGRLEHKCEETVYINGDGTVPGALNKEGTFIRIYPTRQPAYEVPVWTGEGGHGGGDDLMLRDLFAPEGNDKYLRAADQRGGAASILCGIAANRSIAEGGWVKAAEVLPGLERPDYPAMPSDSVPFALPQSPASESTADPFNSAVYREANVRPKGWEAFRAESKQSIYLKANVQLPPPAPGEKRVVFIGDSIIDNWDLERDFPGEGWINRGIGGQRTVEILGRFRNDALALHPDVIFLLAGSNDLATGVPGDAIIDNLREMIRLSRQQGVRIIVSAVLPISDYHKDKEAKFERTKERPPGLILSTNQAIAEMAAQEGAHYLDLHGSLADKEGFLPAGFGADGLHPNETAYKAMSAPVLHAIKNPTC